MQDIAVAFVAEMAGVPQSYVSVTLSMARRLASSMRRLAGEVRVDYVITVPGDAADGADAVPEAARAAISTTTPTKATSIFTGQVGDAYEVEVLSIPEAVVQTPAPTPSPTPAPTPAPAPTPTPASTEEPSDASGVVRQATQQGWGLQASFLLLGMGLTSVISI